MFRRRPKTGPKRLDPRLGLDTVSFETFGWPLQSDDGKSRHWLGDGIALEESFITDAPDYPSLNKQDLMDAYQRTYANLMPGPGDGSMARILEVDVDPRVPVVRELLRIPLSVIGQDGIGFFGALTVLLADCSWYIALQARERGITGMREAVALDTAWGKEADGRSVDEIVETFDPYDQRWDDMVPGHPLTVVRSHLDRIQASIECRPEFYEQAPFLR